MCIRARVKVIGESAFYECKALESADFPDATAIYGNAFFRGGNLKEASFPAVTTIRDMAFWYCEKFDSLTLGATPPAAPNGHRPFDETLPEFRFLHFVGADGAPLSGETLEAVRKAYDDVAGSNGNVAGDGLWYGWTVRASEITIDKAVQTVSCLLYTSLPRSGRQPVSNPLQPGHRFWAHYPEHRRGRLLLVQR